MAFVVYARRNPYRHPGSRRAERPCRLCSGKRRSHVFFIRFDAILDDKRRYKALAKADLVRQYLSWQRRFGATRTQKQAFIPAYSGGAWPKLKEELGSVSWKTLERWKLEQERAGSVLALADKRGVAHKGRTLLTERHKIIILGHALNPNAPNVSQCARAVRKKCAYEGLYVPSEPTIRRFVGHYMHECFDEWPCGVKARRPGTTSAPYLCCGIGTWCRWATW